MKQFKHAVLAGLSFCFLAVACSKSDDSSSDEESGNWVKRGSFDGDDRTQGVVFVIGDTAYFGTGYNGTTNTRYKDFWAYDPEEGQWYARSNFPGAARSSAVAFTVNSKGYIATGYDGINRLADNYEYDPGNNSWTKKADYPDARYEAVAFGIGDKGYVGTGYAGSAQKTFYAFSPAANTWTQVNSIGGEKRTGAVAFVYNNKAYVGTGVYNGSTSETNDLWEFDPSSGTGGKWTEKRKLTNVSDDDYDDDYTDITRQEGVAFVMGDKAYLTVGENGGYTSKTWEYDITNDLWNRKTPFEGSARSGAVGFTVKGRGFVGFGNNSTYYFSNLFEFKPNDEYDSND